MATVAYDLKPLIRRFWESVNQQNWAGLDEIIAEDSIESGGGRTLSREELKAEFAGYATTFSDLHFTIDDMVAEGDQVVTRWTVRGTHTGPLMDMPPTGKSVTITGISIDRVKNGKIVEGWTEFDALGMMQQLGAFPL